MELRVYLTSSDRKKDSLYIYFLAINISNSITFIAIVNITNIETSNIVLINGQYHKRSNH